MENTVKSENKQTGTITISVIFICIMFIVPLFLIYFFVYRGATSMFASVLLFIFVLGLGFLTNLLFYRVMILNDAEAKIDKMRTDDVLFLLGVTFASFMILAITMIGISLNPALITVFENTIGYWFISFFGVSDVVDDIFHSPTFDKIRDFTNSSEFNYNFLITRITKANIEQILDPSAVKTSISTNRIDYGLDFELKLEKENTRQIEALRTLVDMKYEVGHFTWIYLSSVTSLLVAIIAGIIGK